MKSDNFGSRGPLSTGPSYFQQDNLNRIVAGIDAAGMTVHVHAIGDRAVCQSLDAFAFARGAWREAAAA